MARRRASSAAMTTWSSFIPFKAFPSCDQANSSPDMTPLRVESHHVDYAEMQDARRRQVATAGSSLGGNRAELGEREPAHLSLHRLLASPSWHPPGAHAPCECPHVPGDAG